MKANLDCIHCILNKAEQNYEKREADRQKKFTYMKKVYRMIGSSPDDATAPYLTKCVNDLLYSEFNKLEFEKLEFDKSEHNDSYLEFKDRFNSWMLGREPAIEEKITASADPLYSALQFSMAGNFIDMHAVADIDEKAVNDILNAAPSFPIQKELYQRFRKELAGAKKLAFLHDNAGEIVLDKLLIRRILKLNPELAVTSIVRGAPVVNDATLRDAEKAGLCEIVNVIGNGTDIPGTELRRISREAMDVVSGADLIVSKGQGNFETLHECGKNIYYLFLCKCDLFVKRFQLDRFSGLFVNERDLTIQY